MKHQPQRAIAHVGREVFGHWSRERRSIRQGFSALALSTGVGMAAGVVLGFMEGILAEYRGLLVLVPAAIGMRGAIFGALGARIGTGILTGLYSTTLRRGSFTAQNVEASILLSFFSSALAAIVARAAAGAFGLPTISLWELMLVSMLGGLLSSAFILVGVLLLAATAQRRDWDMDAIGSPLITATGDIVTLPALVVATLLLGYEPLATILGVVLFLTAVAAVYRGAWRSPDLARGVVRQSLAVLAYAAIVDVLAGTVLETRIEEFVTSPALLVLIPPFIANCGSLGGILSARLGSDLHLGLITPRLIPEKLAGLEASVTVLFSVAAFTGVGLIAHTASLIAGFASPGLGPMVLISLTAGALATGLLAVVAYASAAATFRFGMDPDNYGIPIVTATMDFFGVLCLVAGIALIGHT
ncbi:MAG TPA: magnesium transporter [Egibacteraceae bacterium]|nr:magnesium transporter [Egibacteraceae bacterium]